MLARKDWKYGEWETNISKKTQTEQGIELKYDECNLEATNHLELSWHMKKIPGWSQDQNADDLDFSGGFRDCPRCEYQAKDKYDINGHRWSEHEDNQDGNINCKFCDEKFASAANLMKHKKIKHREKVENCQNLNIGGCPF